MKILTFKKATFNDAKLLFDWANDEEVRKNSFNSSKIEYEEHITWFQNCLESEDVNIYIFYLDNIPVGQVRLTNIDKEYLIISYSISSGYRGKGLGKSVIRQIETDIMPLYPAIKCLIGKVKPDNIASQKVFEVNSYNKRLSEEYGNCIEYYKMMD